MLIKVTFAILATYRLSRMIVGEDGPFSIFDKIRGFVMRKYNSDHWLYNGIGCPLCVSFWISAIFALYVTDNAASFPLFWFGIAGAVTLIYRRLE